MTRINTIPPKLLTSPHLNAEYRELPRVFKAARLTNKAPSNYVMGKGHVLFFYDKLEWLVNRQESIVSEMLARGYNPQFTQPRKLITSRHIQEGLFNNWTPTVHDHLTNLTRLIEKNKDHYVSIKVADLV